MSDTLPQPFGYIMRDIHGNACEVLGYTAEQLAAAVAMERKRAESLAMMIRMLTSSLKRHWPHAPQPDDLPNKAIDLLRRYDLLGSPLREHTEDDDGAPKQAIRAG